MLEVNRKKGKLSARIASLLIKNPSQYIATMLVGNNIALVVYGIFMAVLLDPIIKSYIQNEGWVLAIQTLISTLLILFAAEFIPKAIFRINPNFMLNTFALPALFFFIFLYPIARFSIWISNFILVDMLHISNKTETKGIVFGKVDLDHLVNEITSENEQISTTDSEIKIFQNALDFSEVKLRDVMIPRTEIVAIDVEESIESLKNRFIETGLSRILIYKDSIDNIIGFIKSSELFKNPKTIKAKLTPVTMVPESMAANRLLELFTREHKNIAVILDEFGGTSGMVTTEDIIEEIFGEIEDEHDNIQHTEKIIGPDHFIFSGRLEIDYLNEEYKLKIPESDDYNTLAGYFFSLHQSIPKQGNIYTYGSMRFKILKVSQTKIELIDLHVLEN